MQHTSSRYFQTFLMFVPVLLMGLGPEPVTARSPYALRNLQEVVDGLKAQLAIDAAVMVAVVPSNPLLVSVQPVEGSERTFRMSFEERFLETLDADELRSIVAHELGHVWIFTHHPYLQTERLANTVAMRAVTRESLERVYSKVWEREGGKGDLAKFLGQ